MHGLPTIASQPRTARKRTGARTAALAILTFLLFAGPASAGPVPIPGSGSHPWDDDVRDLEEAPGDLVPPTEGLVPGADDLPHVDPDVPPVTGPEVDYQTKTIYCLAGDGETDARRASDDWIDVRMRFFMDCMSGQAPWTHQAPPNVRLDFTASAFYCAISCTPVPEPGPTFLPDGTLVSSNLGCVPSCKVLGQTQEQTWVSPRITAYGAVNEALCGEIPKWIAIFVPECWDPTMWHHEDFQGGVGGCPPYDCRSAGQVWVVASHLIRKPSGDGWTLEPSERCPSYASGPEWDAIRCVTVMHWDVPGASTASPPKPNPAPVRKVVSDACEERPMNLPQCRDLSVDVIHN